MIRQKIPVSLCAAVLTGILCIGGTFSYFSDYSLQKNRVAIGKNETHIEEHFPEPSPPGDQEYTEYPKKVWVKNTSAAENGFNVDCYVRVSVSYSNYDIARGVTLIGLDIVNWKYNSEDGYYYYKTFLKEGQSTTPLFTGFSIDRGKIDTLYLDKISEFHIDVYEESVEAGEFTDYQTAWNFYLSPVSG